MHYQSFCDLSWVCLLGHLCLASSIDILIRPLVCYADDTGVLVNWVFGMTCVFVLFSGQCGISTCCEIHIFAVMHFCIAHAVDC